MGGCGGTGKKFTLRKARVDTTLFHTLRINQLCGN